MPAFVPLLGNIESVFGMYCRYIIPVVSARISICQHHCRLSYLMVFVLASWWMTPAAHLHHFPFRYVRIWGRRIKAKVWYSSGIVGTSIAVSFDVHRRFPEVQLPPPHIVFRWCASLCLWCPWRLQCLWLRLRFLSVALLSVVSSLIQAKGNTRITVRNETNATHTLF